ncbi:hypothetical protein JCGZ_22209 [Jatropha curcas]|uniref:Uncharacterized protein n=1 Tax=Jatropha curcas TaxID=180498 RepID=A0A067JTF4_JATCU|nr:hypothetical protein JCGZ_22209 [Jatropha curcas]
MVLAQEYVWVEKSVAGTDDYGNLKLRNDIADIKEYVSEGLVAAIAVTKHEMEERMESLS